MVKEEKKKLILTNHKELMMVETFQMIINLYQLSMFGLLELKILMLMFLKWKVVYGLTKSNGKLFLLMIRSKLCTQLEKGRLVLVFKSQNSAWFMLNLTLVLKMLKEKTNLKVNATKLLSNLLVNQHNPVIDLS